MARQIFDCPVTTKLQGPPQRRSNSKSSRTKKKSYARRPHTWLDRAKSLSGLWASSSSTLARCRMGIHMHDKRYVEGVYRSVSVGLVGAHSSMHHACLQTAACPQLYPGASRSGLSRNLGRFTAGGVPLIPVQFSCGLGLAAPNCSRSRGGCSCRGHRRSPCPYRMRAVCLCGLVGTAHLRTRAVPHAPTDRPSFGLHKPSRLSVCD
jgi:hypothetical protein